MPKLLMFIFIALLCLFLSACSRDQKIAQKQLVLQSLKDQKFIPAGSFKMGATMKEAQVGNNMPAHLVKLTGFYISKYNVSYKKYDLYTKSVGKPLIQKKWIGDFFRSKNHPADSLTWYQANAYCEWLKNKTGLPYSLPSEAQWEYVAKDGGKLDWAFATSNGKREPGKNFPSFQQLADQKGNYGGVFLALPIGSIPCTPMGICGLNGEVDQWVKDWYQADYYAHSPVQDPQGPKTGTEKVYRGGSAEDSPDFNNVFNRYHAKQNQKRAGFRCVINSSLPMSQLRAIAIKKLSQ